MQNKLITQLNECICEMTKENVLDHICKDDVDEWLEDWRNRAAEISISLYTVLRLMEQ